MNLLKEKLDIVLKTDIVPFIWGPPGIGKSAVIKQKADEENIQLIDVRAAQLDSTDWRGIPFVSKQDGVPIAQWAQPEFLPNSGKGILFIDEINRANRQSLQSIFQLVLDKQIGNYKLPDGWKIIAAGNHGDQDDCDVEEFDAALKNRFVHIVVTPKVNSWLKWAESNGTHPLIREYVSVKEGKLHEMPDAATNINAFPTPRSWSMLSDLIETCSDDEKIIRTVSLVGAGTIGVSASTDFLNYVKTREIIKPEWILNKYGTDIKKKLEKLPIDRFHQLNKELVDHIKSNGGINNKQVENLCEYLIDNVEDDTKVAVVQSIVTLQEVDVFNIFDKMTKKMPEVIKLVNKIIQGE